MPLIRSTGLVLDVRYDPSTDTFKDYSRNNHTITNNNVTPVRGKYGGAGSYNSSSSYLNCGYHSSLNTNGAIAIGAWVKTNNPGVSTGCVFSKQSFAGANTGYTFTINSNARMYFYYGYGIDWDNPYTPVLTWNPKYFYYIVVTADSAKIKFYRNGTYISENASNLPISSSSTIARIGQVDNSDYFNGTIGEVMIYNHAPSVAEIKKHYLAKNYYGKLVQAPIPVI